MRKLLLLLLFALPAVAQVPVALSPVPHLQFLSNAGIPLASGCVFTYAAGTTTPATTYRDSTGTTTNTNPIILNAGGFADIWLPNAAFKFTVKSAGGVNCASGGTLWTVDNISGIMGLLNLNNTWTGTNQFNQAITVNLNTNQFIAGTAGNRTTLNFPAPAGNITLTMPSTSQTILGNLSPSITTPIINGVTVVGSPATYTLIANSAGAGTTGSTLTKLSGAPSTALISAAGDVGGVIGICVSGCANVGQSIIEMSGGPVSCVFDNAQVAGDYAQISSTVAGNCHDTGAIYPTSGQVVGRVLASGGGAGSQVIYLFGPEIRPPSVIPASVVCTVFTPVTIVNSVAPGNLQSCSIPANSLIQGSLLDINITGIESAVGVMTIQIGTSLGGGTTCFTTSNNTAAANNQPWNASVKFFVLTAGAAGTANMACEYFGTPNGGGVIGGIGVVGAPTIAINTTIANTLQITTQMSVANPGNSVTEQGLKATVF